MKKMTDSEKKKMDDLTDEMNRDAGIITDVYGIDKESQIELDKTQKGKPPLGYDD